MPASLQIIIPTDRGQVSVHTADIIRIESISNYSRIHFSNGNYPLTVARVLRKFEEMLPPEQFIRTHRTHLVNKKYIKSVNVGKQTTISLLNGETIAISRRKKQVTCRLSAA